MSCTKYITKGNATEYSFIFWNNNLVFKRILTILLNNLNLGFGAPETVLRAKKQANAKKKILAKFIFLFLLYLTNNCWRRWRTNDSGRENLVLNTRKWTKLYLYFVKCCANQMWTLMWRVKSHITVSFSSPVADESCEIRGHERSKSGIIYAVRCESPYNIVRDFCGIVKQLLV